jgi:CitMHS family citrate-Mg2+:H+ or citrate-Ca2+:H+ symporter
MLAGFDHLAILGFLMVITFMTLIMTRRLSAIIALIVVPTVFAMIGGFTATMGPMMLDGVKHLAPTGIMLMFAILYFGVMNDAGLFDPVVKATIKLTQGDPLKVLLGTAILALLVSLDGDGSTTYIIVITAMLPLYQRLRLNPLFLSGIVMLAVGVTNIVPWGGPTARAASALHLDPNALFTPMIPALLGCAAWVVCVACMLGLWERKRLGKLEETPGDLAQEEVRAVYQHPIRLALNGILTLGLLGLLIWGVYPMSVLFILGFALALIINFPSPEAQKERIVAHAPSILLVVSLIFAAGIFTGILSGTKMVDAMTQTILALVSKDMGPHLSIFTAVVSLPLTFFISNDAFYFGMLPILSKTAATYGISAAEMGRASIVGQPVHLLSPLVPSTYLLVSMAKVDFVAHQRFTVLWAIASCLVMLMVGLALKVIPW